MNEEILDKHKKRYRDLQDEYKRLHTYCFDEKEKRDIKIRKLMTLIQDLQKRFKTISYNTKDLEGLVNTMIYAVSTDALEEIDNTIKELEK